MSSAARAAARGGWGGSGQRADRFPLLSSPLSLAAVNGQEVDYAEYKKNRHLRGKTEEKKKERIKASDL